MKNVILDEFQELMRQLSTRLQTYPARLSLSHLTPYRDLNLLLQEIDLLQEMDGLIRYGGGLRFAAVQDISTSLNHALIRDNFLGGEEILEICKALDIHQGNQTRLLAEPEQYPLLYSLAAGLPDYSDLHRTLSTRLDDEGRLLDDASPELRQIRRRKSNIRGDIQDRLQRLMEQEDYKQSMQERLITLRDGRFVLPLKSSGRSRIEGIVHSFSNSGETAFVEPSVIVALNNEMVEIDEKEAAEIRRILREMTAQIAREVPRIHQVLEMLGKLEWLYIRGLYGVETKGVFPVIKEDSYYLDLHQAVHPLLKVENPVRIDIEVGKHARGLIISGPNAGGKTVALKTAGILSLMLQYAIPLPLHPDSEMGIFHEIYAEIGDEQSLDNNLSSFSGHIRQLAEILRVTGPRDLVLIDEIAAATDPREGEILGREIIQDLIEKKSTFIITTHYSGIKELAYSHPELENSFVEFDEKKLEPRYRLYKGGTGSSFALDIARRYGIPDALINRAKKYLESHLTDTEKLVQTLEKERNSISSFKEKAAAELREARQIKRQTEKLQQELQQKQEELKKKGLQALQGELDDALRRISELKKQMKQEKISDLAHAENVTREVRDILDQEKIRQQERPSLSLEELQPGQKVYVSSLDKQGIIETVKGDQVKVRVGIISTFVSREELFTAPDDPAVQAQRRAQHDIKRNFQYILDLRGERVEDALKLLEKDLDVAYMQGAGQMEIIHGKGEGILRKAIWEVLKKTPSVDSFHHAKPEDGGQGKTVIIFKG